MACDEAFLFVLGAVLVEPALPRARLREAFALPVVLLAVLFAIRLVAILLGDDDAIANRATLSSRADARAALANAVLTRANASSKASAFTAVRTFLFEAWARPRSFGTCAAA